MMYRQAALKEPEEIKKNRVIKARKQLPQEEEREKIVLFNETYMRQFKVFLDEEVGMTLRFTNKVIETEADEDCESSDEIVRNGLQKCHKLLKTKIKALSKQLQQTQNDLTSSSPQSQEEDTLTTSEYPSETISD